MNKQRKTLRGFLYYIDLPMEEGDLARELFMLRYEKV